MSDDKLRDDLIKLAYTNPALRDDILPVVKSYELDRWYKSAKDMNDFMDDEGDKEVKNPNPDGKKDKIKVKSLPSSDEGKGVLKKLYDKWKKKFTGGGGSDEDKAKKKTKKKIKKKFKKPSDKQLETLWREMKQDSGRLPDEDKLRDHFEKNIEKAIDFYVENPPKAKNKSKDDPNLKDIAMRYQYKGKLKKSK